MLLYYVYMAKLSKFQIKRIFYGVMVKIGKVEPEGRQTY